MHEGLFASIVERESVFAVLLNCLGSEMPTTHSVKGTLVDSRSYDPGGSWLAVKVGVWTWRTVWKVDMREKLNVRLPVFLSMFDVQGSWPNLEPCLPVLTCRKTQTKHVFLDTFLTFTSSFLTS